VVGRQASPVNTAEFKKRQFRVKISQKFAILCMCGKVYVCMFPKLKVFPFGAAIENAFNSGVYTPTGSLQPDMGTCWHVQLHIVHSPAAFRAPQSRLGHRWSFSLFSG